MYLFIFPPPCRTHAGADRCVARLPLAGEDKEGGGRIKLDAHRAKTFAENPGAGYIF